MPRGPKEYDVYLDTEKHIYFDIWMVGKKNTACLILLPKWDKPEIAVFDTRSFRNLLKNKNFRVVKSGFFRRLKKRLGLNDFPAGD